MKRLMVFSFLLTIFLSAGLMFLIEPIMGRILLPIYGGSPAVWNTCVVCFQALLLIGYAYAHWSLDFFGVRRQAMVHAALLLVSGFAVPLALPVLAPAADSPVRSILVTLVLTVGLPFVLLASNSSLIQRWYSLSQPGDPFALYSVSNAGSLIALLGYPLLYEPVFGLSRGWQVWLGLYTCFIVGSVVCIIALLRSVPSGGEDLTPVATEHVIEERPPRRWEQFGWTFRAAIASSLLLSVTMKVTTDVASAPIFWVVPLSLYLLTFVLAFSPGSRIPRWIVSSFTAIGVAWAMTGFFYTIPFPLWLNLLMLLATVFFGCLLCHGDLADSRPSARYLTQFYLWIALGGAVGGILNSLVAPVVFNSVAEYPITLFFLMFLIHARGGYLTKFPRERMRNLATWLPPATVVIVLFVTALVIRHQRQAASFAHELVTMRSSLWIVIPLGMIAFGLLLARHAGQFEFVVACLIIYSFVGDQRLEPVVAQKRSFFGVMRVYETPRERVLFHGTTVHGAQWRQPPLSRIPIRYYYPTGPFGRSLPARSPAANICVVGLGVGSLAAIGQPGQRLTFFEIDRDVELMARRYFSFLRDGRGQTSVRIGDGRLLLAETPDRTFDLLILDAFSSDAIPTHLLTREALNLDLQKVKPDGLVVIHISNRHLDLSRVFRGWEAAEHRRVALFIFQPTQQEVSLGATAAIAVAIAPDPAVLEALVKGGQWQWLPPGRQVTWTDDRIDLVAALGDITL
ncbi:MAG: fused MFS/spermidine synthase [Acidobacteriota bacterium]